MEAFNVRLMRAAGEDSHDLRVFSVTPNKSMPVGRSSKTASKQLEAGRDNAWIDNPVISRHHAEFTVSTIGQRPVLHLVDKGSMHGTYVNTHKIKANSPWVLQTGAIIQFGSKVVRGEESFEAPQYSIEINEAAEACSPSSPSAGFQVPDSPSSPSSSDVENPSSPIVDLDDDSASSAPSISNKVPEPQDPDHAIDVVESDDPDLEHHPIVIDDSDDDDSVGSEAMSVHDDLASEVDAEFDESYSDDVFDKLFQEDHAQAHARVLESLVERESIDASLPSIASPKGDGLATVAASVGVTKRHLKFDDFDFNFELGEGIGDDDIEVAHILSKHPQDGFSSTSGKTSMRSWDLASSPAVGESQASTAKKVASSFGELFATAASAHSVDGLSTSSQDDRDEEQGSEIQARGESVQPKGKRARDELVADYLEENGGPSKRARKVTPAQVEDIEKDIEELQEQMALGGAGSVVSPEDVAETDDITAEAGASRPQGPSRMGSALKMATTVIGTAAAVVYGLGTMPEAWFA